MILDEKKTNRSHLNLQKFLDDMGLVQTQLKDPNLNKPAFDVGNNAVRNYLLWLILAELMLINDKGEVNA